MEKTGKTQPQELLESILPIETRNESEKYPSEPVMIIPNKPMEPKFPTIEEQNKYWEDKEKAAEPKPPRKWSIARRRRFNATLAKKKELEAEKNKLEQEIANGPREPLGWEPVPLPPQEPQVKHCPFCGKSIERFLS